MPSRPPPAITCAPPMPLSSTRAQSVPVLALPHHDAALGAARVLRRVGQRLGDREVDGGLGVCGCIAPSMRMSRCTGMSRATGERRERGIQPAIVEDGRMDAARELAEFGDGRLRRHVRLGDQCLRGIRIVVDLLLGEPESHSDRDESRLDAVVEVAFDAGALHLRSPDRSVTLHTRRCAPASASCASRVGTMITRASTPCRMPSPTIAANGEQRGEQTHRHAQATERRCRCRQA